LADGVNAPCILDELDEAFWNRRVVNRGFELQKVGIAAIVTRQKNMVES
jgi:hypothetical protein